MLHQAWKSIGSRFKVSLFKIIAVFKLLENKVTKNPAIFLQAQMHFFPLLFVTMTEKQIYNWEIQSNNKL